MNSIHDLQERIAAVLALAPVVPVLVIEDLAHAVPLARALVAGGLPAIEVTLRTPVALDAVRAIANEVEGAAVGVGSVRRPADFAAAQKAGATFAVSPGASASLIAAAQCTDLPWLPGAATASEAMTLADHGYRYLKFFPAESIGGTGALRGLGGPLPDLRFCATGGIGPDNAPQYLALANVPCVGGSWVCPPAAVNAGDWARIEALARVASQLRG
ncbi:MULTISPECIES: bifunctional 4-hydroxy-2-oxoglutarate aldolase/2-dehydro-3-deoxy-phosphogluconate aldolase [unclassified Lysobacter]|uniref:bifunctional 4-hydroxy-2-oxoglutarate aldolase/2-dehydro-3-deoxy-phosphogluconate aldolase n=1 Tax=unclassified Lysobacter TaxID=2635362 RepID=UPI0006F8F461|nr:MULTISPECIES: bifunctional 4-hydroxy-2-oxoglutarate aldolase/2-dehydro-3-deoxy-phosphogluconate aldolase [unclassified Lysobacter]KRA16946.1 keto-deoxy-phosphogluconate aldolase [Lysobacter sp. Root604]KRD28745.1 keto-deoxy-phosphogluconate aldolase [Lysobacter sp. Root916]KRD73892.1 keto-deoxy-phosphogluconate aldolase [Lysobacter sp. Root983]